MLYIIGLGLNIKGISKEGLEAVKRCKKIYLENYTIDFPYSSSELVEKVEYLLSHPAIGKLSKGADTDLFVNPEGVAPLPFELIVDN